MDSDWTGKTRAGLLALRREGEAWGYRPGSAPAAEPTALAGLALQGHEGPEVAGGAARWLARGQARDGSMAAASGLDAAGAGWPTPLACLLWSAVGGHEAALDRAVAWLLRSRGLALPRAKDDPMGHDTTLVGWPWVADTHSWVEPTAMAILALARAGQGAHPRVAEGLAVLRDRAIPSGGWNLGNPVVFGTILRPFPGQTGLALLALAAGDPAPAPAPCVRRGLDFLLADLPGTRAPSSLGWGVLALRAWGEAPEAARGWLAEAAEMMARRLPTSPIGPALLLLADDEGTPGRLGIAPRAGRLAHAS